MTELPEGAPWPAHANTLMHNRQFTEQAFLAMSHTLERFNKDSTTGQVLKILTILDEIGFKVVVK